MNKQTRNKAYPQEFREQVVKLVQAGGQTVSEIAREFEISTDSVRRWLKQAERDAGSRQDGLSTPERKELAQLRRDNRRLRMEREILSKAVAGDLRGAACAGAAASGRVRRVAAAGSAADAVRRPAGGDPAAGDNHPPGPAGHGGGRPGPAGVPRRRAQPAVGGGHHVCADSGRVCVLGHGAGRVQPQGRGLGHERAPDGRAGELGTGDGRRHTRAVRGRVAFRPRLPVHGAGLPVPCGVRAPLARATRADPPLSASSTWSGETLARARRVSVRHPGRWRLARINQGGLLTICQGQKSSKKGQLLPVDLARLNQGNNPSHSQNGS